MRPKKKRVDPLPPDSAKEEPAAETVGGTNGEERGDDEDWGKTVDGDESYGRPQELDEDEYI